MWTLLGYPVHHVLWSLLLYIVTGAQEGNTTNGNFSFLDEFWATLFPLDIQTRELEDQDNTSICSVFNSNGPPEGTFYNYLDSFEISCECSEDPASRRAAAEVCPVTSVQVGAKYLKTGANWTMADRSSCKTFVTYQVVLKPIYGTAHLIIQCVVPNTLKVAVYKAFVQVRPDPVPPTYNYHNDPNNHLVFYIILSGIIFMVILYAFLGVYCRKRNNAARRVRSVVDVGRMLLGRRAAEQQSRTASQPGLVTVSQGVQRDQPPSYTEAMLRHQESGELPPSYSHACALITANLLAAKKAAAESEESPDIQEAAGTPSSAAGTDQGPQERTT